MSTTQITQTGKKGDIHIAFGFERPADFSLPAAIGQQFTDARAQHFTAPEPCVYLYTQWNKQVVVKIPIVHMHLFDYRDRDQRTGDPVALAKCREIAEMLYGQPTINGASRVLDVLTDWMNDIKNLPPPSTFRNPEQALSYMEKMGMEVMR